MKFSICISPKSICEGILGQKRFTLEYNLEKVNQEKNINLLIYFSTLIVIQAIKDQYSCTDNKFFPKIQDSMEIISLKRLSKITCNANTYSHGVD